MVVQSAYNVVVPLQDAKPGYFALLNTLAGTIDVIDEDVRDSLEELPSASGCAVTAKMVESFMPAAAQPCASMRLNPASATYLERRGYLYGDAGEERQRSRQIYNEMLRLHRQVVRQPLVVIPSYNCDLKCPYCWQRLYNMDSPVMSETVANDLFRVIPHFVEVDSPDRVDFTIFGGEPLQDVEVLRARVVDLLTRGRDLGFSTKIISNGVGLAAAVPHIAGRVDLIQVTIDGPADVHRRRRPLPKRGDSFTPMVEGITKALAAGIRINVRVNVDRTNLPRLPELAGLADEHGWLDSGLLRFHLAPVKNHNPRKPTNSEAELLISILDLAATDQRMEIFDLTGFSGLKYFSGFKETGLFSLHRFFNCEAQINLFVFDLHGDIFACWDAAGLKDHAVGRFRPEIEMYHDKLGRWRKRTSLDISGCDGCTSSPHCGGGCQFLALEHAGSFLESSCDSMMEGYVQAVRANASWLVEVAEAGNHAVGLVTQEGPRTVIDRPFGLVDAQQGADLAVGCA